jgi:hypothetical protein
MNSFALSDLRVVFNRILLTGFVFGLGFGCRSLDNNSGAKSTVLAPPTIVGEGQSCGGSSVGHEIPPQCAAGLTCKNEANDAAFPGMCVKQASPDTAQACDEDDACKNIPIQQSTAICVATGKVMPRFWKCQNRHCRLFTQTCAGTTRQVCHANSDCDGAIQQSAQVCQATGQTLVTSWRCVYNLCEVFTPSCK